MTIFYLHLQDHPVNLAETDPQAPLDPPDQPGPLENRANLEHVETKAKEDKLDNLDHPDPLDPLDPVDLLVNKDQGEPKERGDQLDQPVSEFSY